jgi:hypothetical protein
MHFGGRALVWFFSRSAKGVLSVLCQFGVEGFLRFFVMLRVLFFGLPSWFSGLILLHLCNYSEIIHGHLCDYQIIVLLQFHGCRSFLPGVNAARHTRWPQIGVFRSKNTVKGFFKSLEPPAVQKSGGKRRGKRKNGFVKSWCGTCELTSE